MGGNDVLEQAMLFDKILLDDEAFEHSAMAQHGESPDARVSDSRSSTIISRRGWERRARQPPNLTQC